MKFKVLPESPLFAQLSDVQVQLKNARQTIESFLKSKGFTGQYAKSTRQNIISCDAVEIEGDMPPGWRRVGEAWQHLYYPLAKNKKELAELAALPVIKNELINELVKFNFHVDGDLAVHYRPGAHFHTDYILLETNSITYKPVDGMIEIMDSEFQELYQVIDDLKE